LYSPRQGQRVIRRRFNWPWKLAGCSRTEKKKGKEREDLLWKEIEQFRGGDWEEEKKDEERSKLIETLENAIRSIIGRPPEGEYHIPKGWEDKIKSVVQENFTDFYDDLKGEFGGLKFRRHQDW